MDLGKLSAGHLLLINILTQRQTLSQLIITAPTTTTVRMYQISDTDFEQTLKAYENHNLHIWSFLSLETNGLFFF